MYGLNSHITRVSRWNEEVRVGLERLLPTLNNLLQEHREDIFELETQFEQLQSSLNVLFQYKVIPTLSDVLQSLKLASLLNKFKVVKFSTIEKQQCEHCIISIFPYLTLLIFQLYQFYHSGCIDHGELELCDEQLSTYFLLNFHYIRSAFQDHPNF